MSAIGPPSRPLDYYKWYWRDWRANRKVQRMSYVERGLYRELLDECWAEGSIPASIEKLAEICGCQKEVMAEAWQVLSNCFTPIENRFINDKIESLRTEKDRERLAKSSAGRKGGISKSTGRRGSKATVKQDLASAKQLPEDAKLLPYRREEKRREDIRAQDDAKAPVAPQVADLLPGVDPEVLKDFVSLRKKLRAPITPVAAKGLIREAEKAGITLTQALTICCERSWRGFNADWLKDKKAKSDEFDWDEALRGAA